MVIKCTVSSVEGKKIRVVVGGQVSAPLPLLESNHTCSEEVSKQFLPAMQVAVAFFGNNLADGVVLGVIE